VFRDIGNTSGVGNNSPSSLWEMWKSRCLRLFQATVEIRFLDFHCCGIFHRRLGHWLFLMKIDLADLLVTKKYVEYPLVGRRSQCDRVTVKSFTDAVASSLILKVPLRMHLPNNVADVVFDGGKLFRKRMRADAVAICRYVQPQCLMRTLAIINVSIFIEVLLNVRKLTKTVPPKQIHIQCAMKPFILSLSLGMMRARMANTNTQPNHPHRQWRVLMLQVVSPGCSVIHGHTFRQSVTAERRGQVILDRFGSLIQTRLQAHNVTGMIIQNRQRMTSALIGCPEPPFEIHLPELIRSFMLESLRALMFVRLVRVDFSIPVQNPVDRAIGRKLQLAPVCQNASDLTCAPTWVPRPFSQDLLLNCGFRSSGRVMRSSRSVHQRRFASCLRSRHPLIKSFRTHLKTSTNFADVGPRLRSQPEYFLPKRHALLHLVPGHSMPPPRIESPYWRCYPCLGTCVTYVSGPNTVPGGEYAFPNFSPLR
jgi:hypothetical protein